MVNDDKMSNTTQSRPGSQDQQKTSILTVTTSDTTSSATGDVGSTRDVGSTSAESQTGDSSSSSTAAVSSADTATQTQISDECQQEKAISEELKAHLAHRLETGLDGSPKLEDPFLNSVRRDRTAFIVARKYTQDASVTQPVSQDMLSQNTPEDQLVVLSRLMTGKDVSSSLWIQIMGIEEKAMNGISDLCRLPTETISKRLRSSEHRQHRSHIEIHPDYTYIQLLIQQTSHPSAKSPIYDIVRKSFIPDSSAQTVHSKGRPSATGSGDTGGEVVRVGFMSMFVIPHINVLVTITLPYYDCPASRLVIQTGKMDTTQNGQLEIATDVTLLGLSMVHRVVGYASGVTRQADCNIASWARLVNEELTVERINEINEMIMALQDFKKRLKPLQKVLRRLQDRSERNSITASPPQDDSLPQRYASRPSIGMEMVEQSVERLDEVIEDVDGLVERCKVLEDFVFSMMSMRANDSMERLAIVTIVFLPLTFIASYFSMGFDEFADLSRPPVYFWEVSVPLSVCFFIIFAYSNIKRGYLLSRKILEKAKKKGEREFEWAKKDVDLWWRANRRKWGFGDDRARIRGRAGNTRRTGA
ncbi:hypothetical protein IAU59_001042 [Kwoniella sp. CBS 9459]